MTMGYSGGFFVGLQPKKVGRMFTPVERKSAGDAGKGGKSW